MADTAAPVVAITEEFWADRLARLVDVSLTDAPDTRFFPGILRDLSTALSAHAVLYVRYDGRRGGDFGPVFVAGDSFPAQHLRPEDYDEVHPDLLWILQEAIHHYHAPTSYFEAPPRDDGTVARVLEVRFQELETRNLLVIIGDPSGPIPSAEPADREAAFRFLISLSHFHNSFERAQTNKLRNERRDAVKEINAARGTVAEVAAKLCETWQQLVGAGGVRLWLYNHELHELDLFHERADPVITARLAKTRNRLPFASLAGKALADETTNRSSDPAAEDAWDPHDPHEGAVLERLPHLISVPLLLPGRRDGDPRAFEGPRLGVLDLLLADMSTVRQPDHRLNFLGELSALALDRAHLTDRRAVLARLTDIEMSLIHPRSSRPLGELRGQYLSDLIVEIKAALNAEGVSIFEAYEGGAEIRCCKSTGLEARQRDGTYKPVRDGTVYYRKGEGKTWAVFESGRYCVESDVTQHPFYQGKYRETRKRRMENGHDPFLAVPLLGRDKKPVGVIRVLLRNCHARPGRLQNFSSHDLDLLRLIASQVSPILQMLRHDQHRARLMGMVDHDVTQPLQAIVACCKNLIRGRYPYTFDEGVENRLTYMLANAWTATKRIQERAKAKDVDVSATIPEGPARKTYPSVARFFIERNIDVEPLRRHENVRVRLADEQAADALGAFEASEKYIQAVGNVMHNAVKYAYPNTLVEVRARQEGTRLVCDVTSVGLPIDPTERDRIFDDWARGLAALRHDMIEGSGQGLYITRQIMKSLGGDVVLVPGRLAPEVRPPADFPPAEYNTFRLTLPGAFR